MERNNETTLYSLKGQLLCIIILGTAAGVYSCGATIVELENVPECKNSRLVDGTISLSTHNN